VSERIFFMKTYPSIPYPGTKGVGKQLHTFAKIDGSNLRFEWAKNRGWYKVGTRRRLLCATDPVYGPALPLFHRKLGEPLERIIRAQKWPRVIVYCEYFGPNSLGGQHEEGDEMDLVVIDVNPYKQGFLLPVPFLKLFEEYSADYLGYLTWTEEFIAQVHRGELEGASFEGVVGKGAKGKQIERFKTKTKAWKDAILERYGEERGRRLLNS
jgi:hypothetical protein